MVGKTVCCACCMTSKFTCQTLTTCVMVLGHVQVITVQHTYCPCKRVAVLINGCEFGQSTTLGTPREVGSSYVVQKRAELKPWLGLWASIPSRNISIAYGLPSIFTVPAGQMHCKKVSRCHVKDVPEAPVWGRVWMPGFWFEVHFSSDQLIVL